MCFRTELSIEVKTMPSQSSFTERWATEQVEPILEKETGDLEYSWGSHRSPLTKTWQRMVLPSDYKIEAFFVRTNLTGFKHAQQQKSCQTKRRSPLI